VLPYVKEQAGEEWVEKIMKAVEEVEENLASRVK